MKGAHLGWALAAAAVAVGWLQYGVQGLALALSVIVFWLVLQFSQALRAMRVASARPVGHVASAVMLHARLQTGMRLMQVLKLTRSLGKRVADDPETFVWHDDAGDGVRVELVDGRVARWTLDRGADGSVPVA